jgi:hypothetical protein
MSNELEGMRKQAVVAWSKILSRNLPGMIKKNYEKPQGSWFPGRDLNPGPPSTKQVANHEDYPLTQNSK